MIRSLEVEPFRLRLLFTFAPGDPVSELIRKVTGQSVTHVGIKESPNRVVSAELKGVVGQSFEEFLSGGRQLVASYRATERGHHHLLLWRAKAHIGDKYAIKSLPGLAWVSLVRRWLGKSIKNPVHEPKQVVCSEFVLYLDDETGFVHEFIGLDPETTTPGDILARLRTGGPTFECEFDNGA